MKSGYLLLQKRPDGNALKKIAKTRNHEIETSVEEGVANEMTITTGGGNKAAGKETAITVVEQAGKGFNDEEVWDTHHTDIFCECQHREKNYTSKWAFFAI